MSAISIVEGRGTLQPVVSRNVKILMATRDLNQQGVAAIIGKTQGAVQHKLAGRADWTIDELVTLAQWAGDHWPVARFLNDPEGQATVTEIPADLTAIEGKGRQSGPRQSPLLASITSPER